MKINLKLTIPFLLSATFILLLVSCGKESQIADTQTLESKAVAKIDIDPSPMKKSPKLEPTKLSVSKPTLTETPLTVTIPTTATEVQSTPDQVTPTSTPTQVAPTSTPTQVPPTPVATPSQVPIHVQKARGQLALDLAIPETNFIFIKSEPTDWNDASLGCAKPGYMYTQVITPGYTVLFELDGISYVVHTDKDGNNTARCDIGSAVVPLTSTPTTSILSHRDRKEFERNLPHLSHFAINKSDRFIVDFEDVIAAHPYPGQRSPVPHNDAQLYFSNTDERWRNAKHPSDYPPIYAVADGIITGVDSYSLNDHTNFDPPWWHVKYGLGITFAREGDTTINFIYAIEPYINLENKPDDFYEQFILVKRGQVVKKGDVLAYMYVPQLEEKIGPKASTHIAFALARQGQGNWDMYAPAIFSESIVDQFGDLWQNPKEGWQSTSYGNDWARAKGVPVGMGWMIDANENPFGDWPLDVIAYDGIRDLELDGQARLDATDIGFAKEDLIIHFAGNGDYTSKEFDIPTEWQVMIASIGGPMSVKVTFDDGRTSSLANNGPEAGYMQIISGVMSPGRTYITVEDPSGWGWAIAIAPAGSTYVIPGDNNPNPSCPPGCPPFPSLQ